MIENSELKRTLDSYKRKVAMYKSVGFDEMCSRSKSSPYKFYTPQVNRFNAPYIKQCFPSKSPTEFTKGVMKNLMKENVTLSLQEKKHGLLKTYDYNNKDEKTSTDLAFILPFVEKSSTNSDMGLSEHKSSEISNGSMRKRVLILGDEKGRGLCKKLQLKLGDEFSVRAILKPGASANNVLGDCQKECRDFTSSDCVIMILGRNDTNPMLLQSILYFYSINLSHTNVILCNNNKNLYLREKKVNELFRLLASNFNNVNYIETLDYSSGYDTTVNTTELTKLFLREILRLNYEINYEISLNKKDLGKQKIIKKMISKGIQTDSNVDCDNSLFYESNGNSTIR